MTYVRQPSNDVTRLKIDWAFLILFVIFSSFSIHANNLIFRIDLGIDSQATPGNWNNFTAGSAGANPMDLSGLVDIDGNRSSINLGFSETFATAAGISGTAANWNGPYPGSLRGLPESALRDGMFVQNDGKAILTFSGLNPKWTYNFTLYGARGNNGGGVRYELFGENVTSAISSSVYLFAAESVIISSMKPTSNGSIIIQVSQTESGNTKQASLNYIQIEAVEPEETKIISTSWNTNSFTLMYEPKEKPVDIYRSADLQNWGTPVATGHTGGTYVDNDADPADFPSMFYRVVRSAP